VLAEVVAAVVAAVVVDAEPELGVGRAQAIVEPSATPSQKVRMRSSCELESGRSHLPTTEFDTARWAGQDHPICGMTARDTALART
jgi:hypothetical protein